MSIACLPAGQFKGTNADHRKDDEHLQKEALCQIAVLIAQLRQPGRHLVLEMAPLGGGADLKEPRLQVPSVSLVDHPVLTRKDNQPAPKILVARIISKPRTKLIGLTDVQHRQAGSLVLIADE